ncbi:MAG: tetratricopeptide repeat protein [Rickettsiales bacterium]|jgi:tetratricopeptide (TPR) repeat protein|nr:tetratricopeptide repeat protein [Rickettsiales bacterium]
MDFNLYVRGNTLEISRTTVNIGELVSFLQSNTHITKLKLNCCAEIDAEGIEELAKLIHLTSLNLSDNIIGDKNAEALAHGNLTRLTPLNSRDSFMWFLDAIKGIDISSEERRSRKREVEEGSSRSGSDSDQSDLISRLSEQHDMAVVLYKQGNYSKAMETYQAVFEKRRDVLGPDHPDTLSTRHNMAVVLNNQGNYSEALKIFLEVLNIQKVKLGSDHPSTSLTNRNIEIVSSKLPEKADDKPETHLNDLAVEKQLQRSPGH